MMQLFSSVLKNFFVAHVSRSFHSSTRWERTCANLLFDKLEYFGPDALETHSDQGTVIIVAFHNRAALHEKRQRYEEPRARNLHHRNLFLQLDFKELFQNVLLFSDDPHAFACSMNIRKRFVCLRNSITVASVSLSIAEEAAPQLVIFLTEKTEFYFSEKHRLHALLHNSFLSCCGIDLETDHHFPAPNQTRT